MNERGVNVTKNEHNAKKGSRQNRNVNEFLTATRLVIWRKSPAWGGRAGRLERSSKVGWGRARERVIAALNFEATQPLSTKLSMTSCSHAAAIERRASEILKKKICGFCF